MIYLAELDPKFRAWLEANDYLNGFGPRSIVINGQRILIPWHMPTPGCRDVFLQHDLDYLAGGSEVDRLSADDRLRDGLLAVAGRSSWVAKIAIKFATPTIYGFCRDSLSAHFRHRATARTQAELIAEMAVHGYHP